MPESSSHKRAKNREAGKNGKTEVPLNGNRRLDAASKKRAVEIERSSNMNSLKKAARRLRDSGKSQKSLQVPQQNMSKAAKAMKVVGVKGSVKNMSNTKRRSVKP